MAKHPEPVVLDLATLPRDQMGPFLILGLDKAADKEETEAHWADRVKWARKGLLKVPLEDVNWARDALTDVEKRVGFDAGSLNADTNEGYLGQLARRYGLRGGQATRMWQPLDVEKPLADYAPPADVPAPDAVRAALGVPAVPEDYPAVPSLLESLVQQTPGPWALELPPQDHAS
jgi:hypothetical protein